MAEVTFTINKKVLVAMMRDPKVVNDLARRAKAVAAACNSQSEWGGYEWDIDTSGSRPRARVYNIKHSASDDESRNNRMIRALDFGR